MRKVFFIGIGGILGAILRYWIRGIPILSISMNAVINTFLINVAGCFLISFVITISLAILKHDTAIRLGITTGFLGAFTTFSTLCREAAELGIIFGLTYVVTSAILGLVAVYLGFLLANHVVPKSVKKASTDLTVNMPDKGGLI